MDRTSTRTIVLGLMIALSLCVAAEAGRSNGYSMEILVDGKPLREHPARGTLYVEALQGREYAIRLTNHTGERVAVALAVDGLNSIDAKAGTARKASKWVLDPHQVVVIDGWQTSEMAARRFFFTTEERSYGAWLGKTANLGVIEAVVFRERVRRRPIHQERSKAAPGGLGDASSGRRAPVPDPSPEPMESREKERSLDLSDEMAATGIGREVSNPVQRVEFVCEDRAAASLRVRYEYRPQLVALGILPRPVDEIVLDRRENARGFQDMEFAPDPFAGP